MPGRGGGRSSIHDTCPDFWAPPLVTAEEVLLDMTALVVLDGRREGGREPLRCRWKTFVVQRCVWGVLRIEE